MAEAIDRERWPGWHWNGGRKIKVGDPVACGIPFMSPRGGLVTDNRDTVQCVECLKILEAPTNTLRLAALGAAVERLCGPGVCLEIERLGEQVEVRALGHSAADAALDVAVVRLQREVRP